MPPAFWTGAREPRFFRVNKTTLAVTMFSSHGYHLRRRLSPVFWAGVLAPRFFLVNEKILTGFFAAISISLIVTVSITDWGQKSRIIFTMSPVKRLDIGDMIWYNGW